MATLESMLVSGPVKPQAPLPTLKLLSISPNAEDHETLRHIVTDFNCSVFPAETLYEALNKLASKRFAVILCEEILEDGTWKDILDQPGGPPVVVTSRLADERLWCEVLNLGGYDVLAKPFSNREVLHLLKTITLRVPVDTPRVRIAGAV